MQHEIENPAVMDYYEKPEVITDYCECCHEEIFENDKVYFLPGGTIHQDCGFEYLERFAGIAEVGE